MNEQLTRIFPTRIFPTRIFIVEDEALIAMELKDRLTRLDYTVCGVAARGEVALGQIIAEKPDLVLMDINLAGELNGIETASHLRDRSDVPVVFLTAYSDDSMLRRAADAGPFGYLVKPFEERELHATIQMALYKHRMERALREANAELEARVQERTRQLAASQERFAAFARTGGDWLWEADPDGRFVYFSAGMTKSGCDVSRHLGRTWSETAARDPENRARLDGLEALMARRQSFRDFVYQIHSESGATCWCAISGDPILDSANDFRGYRGVARDVTETVKAQAELRARNNMLEAMLKAIPDAVRVVDAEKRTIMMNDQMYGLFDLDRQADLAASDRVHHSLLEVARRGEYGPGDPETLARDRLAAAERRLAAEGSFQYERRLKSGRWFEGRIQAIAGGGWAALYRDVTEAKQRERELVRQSALLETIFGNMGDGISVFDENLTLVAANARLFDLIGLDPAIGRPGAALRDILVAQARGGEFGDCDPEAEADRRCQEFRQHQPMVRARTRPNGRTIEVRRNPIPGGGFVTIYVDITERKQWEQKLRALNATLEQRVAERTAALAASERVFASLAEASPVGIFRVDGEGHRTYVNRRWCEIAGLEVEEALASEWGQMVYPEDRARILGEWADAARSRTSFRSEYRIQRPDGAVTWVIGQAVEIADEAGGITGYIGTLTDITEREAAAREIRAVRGHLLDAFESVGHGIMLTDADDRILLFNRSYAEHYGGPADEIKVGARFEDIFRIAIERRLIVVPAGQEKEEFIAERMAWHRRADGVPMIRLQSSGRVLSITERRARNGGVIAIGIDVTDQLRTEQQLREAQKMEAIGRLTGGLAHDFNNYLGVIIGNLDMMQERVAADPATTKLIDAALSGAERSAELTRSLLAFSRRQPLDPRRLDVSQRLDAIVSLLKRTLGEDIVLTTKFAPDLWPVRIDGAQLDSCIVNLANNARDAMPAGGALTIATRNAQLDAAYARINADVEAGDYVLIEVSDTGAGMASETLAQAFEPFFTTKAPDHGTGLGLSMVYGFVKQSGGHITITSELGHGTAVKIYLPRDRQMAVAAAAAAQPAPARGTETILVVEDNDQMRQAAVAQLTSLGYQVIEANSGAAALPILNRDAQRLDLLFTDIVMPGKPGGYDLALLALERRPGIRIVLTSGFPGHTVHRDAPRLANLALLGKPYRKAELAQAIRSALETEPFGTGGAAA